MLYSPFHQNFPDFCEKIRAEILSDERTRKMSLTNGFCLPKFINGILGWAGIIM
jgi:hypothetical protein